MADDIVAACKKMVADANAQLEKYENEQKKNGVKKPASMRTFLSGNPTSGDRTPAQQAKEIVAGRSWTCDGAHEAGAARHVGPKLNGKNLTDMSSLKKAVSKEDYDKFVEVYADAMKSAGLHNFAHKSGFLPNSVDPLHVELPYKNKPEDVEACKLEYAKLTRDGNAKRNDSFEKANKAYLDDYEKKHPKKAGAGS